MRFLATTLLCLAPATAHAEWHEVSTEHFQVYADDTPERVTRFATRLERFDRMLRLVNRAPDTKIGPANRVTVFMVGDRAAVERLHGGRNVAGFYIPRAGASVAFVPRGQGAQGWWDISGQTVLFHEYAHHFTLTSQARLALPAWYVEGSAEFYATTIMRDDGSVVLGQTPGHRAFGLIRGPRIPVATLLAAKPGTRQDDAFYGRGWLLTHYSMLTPGMGAKLSGYLDAINAGATPEAASARFGDLADLDRKLETYVRRRTVASAQFSAEQLPVGEIRTRRLTAGEAAVMPARIRSQRGVDAQSAPAVLAMARAAAAPYPNDPGAQIALAEAEFDAGNFAEAGAAADRARAVQPRMVDALLYKGRAEVAMAGRDKAGTDRWKAARRWFIQAAAIDNIDPRPLYDFYTSFGQEGIAPTANAKTGLLLAQQFAPQDRPLRFSAGAMLVMDGKPAQARALLRPIAYSPHGGGMATHAGKIIAAIDANDLAAARALLERKPDENAGADGEPANS